MIDIDKIIREAEALKPMPQIANKIMSIAENPKSSMTEISDVIIYDQSLTTNILRVCNSAYFGLPKNIDSIHQAIIYIGLEQLVDIVLMSSGSGNFQGEQEGYGLDKGGLWRYSVLSALITNDLTEVKGLKDNHLIFTAALIKDIGKVVLNQYVAKDFEEINRLVKEEGLSFGNAEKKVIGIDHAELGGMIAKKWEFSPRMVSIIENHHKPQDSLEASFESSIVYTADTLCMMMGIGVGADGLAYRFYKEVIDQLDFTEKDFQKIMAGFSEKIDKVEDLTNLN